MRGKSPCTSSATSLTLSRARLGAAVTGIDFSEAGDRDRLSPGAEMDRGPFPSL
jgi:hypothetical protein